MPDERIEKELAPTIPAPVLDAAVNRENKAVVVVVSPWWRVRLTE